MSVSRNSTQGAIAHRFADIDRYPRDILQTNKENGANNRTKTILRNSPEHSSNVQDAQDKKREQEREMKKPVACTISFSESVQRLNNIMKRIFHPCIVCCRRKKSRLATARKKKVSCFKRLRKKSKCRRSRRIFKEQDSVSTVDYRGSAESSKRRRKRTREVDKAKDKKKSRSKKLKMKETADSSETLLSTHTFQTDEDEKSAAYTSAKDFPDFTKSCCYLCAKNTMAIAAAISNPMEKSHISIQASTQFFRDLFTSDKSCNPVVHVRTVQSSVRVKMRDMSTLYPEKKKSKKLKPKLKLKKLNIFTKVKNAKSPAVRTVACGTDKPIRRNNVPQCRATHGTHCVAKNK